MAHESPFPTPDAEIEHQAAAWLARRDRGLTAAEQDEFFEWLAVDPRHGEWLARHQQTVAGLKLLAQWRPEHGARPNPDLLAAPSAPASGAASKALRWFLPIGLAAAAVITVLVWRGLPETAAISIPLGELTPIVRRVLEDGSTIDLNRGAEVEVVFTAARRDIRLLRGEANFTVAKNPERPFIVHVGGIEVRAVGTAFNVNYRTQAVEVLVTEGKVQVSHSSPEPADGNSATDTVVMVPILLAGQRTIVSLADREAVPRIDAVSSQEIARVVAWQPRQLEFSETPLAQVVAEFNASNRIKLVVDDPRLASLPIGASLRSDNVEGFVRVLEAGFHVTAERRADGVIVLRPAP
jgi:transmembrane sensor